ncbi:MAG TPA: hypothetical protein VF081_07585, partial [Solirubrobacterales bacterium]
APVDACRLTGATPIRLGGLLDGHHRHDLANALDQHSSTPLPFVVARALRARAIYETGSTLLKSAPSFEDRE